MNNKPARRSRPLSERIALMQQLIPLTLLCFVMLYEVTLHLLFPRAGPPILLAIEVLVFGIVGPMAVWLTLYWIQGEIRAREAVQGELDLRTRMMLEMHHRIKNNLQTIADLLSLELTRAPGRSAAESLRDSVARIKSIAAAHELLSLDEIGATDITELAQRVAANAHAGQARVGQTLDVRVEGPKLFLPSKSATAFALVVNELVSNALEHGLATRAAGMIEIRLARDAGQVRVQVQDDGVGLGPAFELDRQAGLGLRIVRTLVEKDLHGTLQLRDDAGTCAEFTFPIDEGRV